MSALISVSASSFLMIFFSKDIKIIVVVRIVGMPNASAVFIAA